jgi:hypothetical protein
MVSITVRIDEFQRALDELRGDEIDGKNEDAYIYIHGGNYQETCLYLKDIRRKITLSPSTSVTLGRICISDCRDIAIWNMAFTGCDSRAVQIENSTVAMSNCDIRTMKMSVDIKDSDVKMTDCIVKSGPPAILFLNSEFHVRRCSISKVGDDPGVDDCAILLRESEGEILKCVDSLPYFRYGVRALDKSALSTDDSILGVTAATCTSPDSLINGKKLSLPSPFQAIDIAECVKFCRDMMDIAGTETFADAITELISLRSARDALLKSVEADSLAIAENRIREYADLYKRMLARVDNISFSFLDDSHAFVPLRGQTLNAIVNHAKKLAETQPDGGGILCTPYLRFGKVPVKRLHCMIPTKDGKFDEKDLEAWLSSISMYPEAVRLLAEGKIDNGEHSWD